MLVNLLGIMLVVMLVIRLDRLSNFVHLEDRRHRYHLVLGRCWYDQFVGDYDDDEHYYFGVGMMKRGHYY